MKFNCPHCTQKLHCEDRLAGKVVRCPNCNRRLTIPATQQALPEKAPAAEPEETKPKPTPTARRGAKPRATATKPRPAQQSARRQSTSAKPHRTDSTNVSLSISLVMGLLFAILFYVVVHVGLANTSFGELFLERGWVPYVLVVFMGWSVGILILKLRKLQRQKQAMLLDVLPTEIAEDITADNVIDFLEHVNSLPERLHESFMVKRMRLGLEHFNVRHSNPEVASMMMSQSEIDNGSIQSSYSVLKAFLWAIPILGFIGTVLGISNAVSGFAGSLTQVQDIQVLTASLNNVTGGLAVAFDTTLVALVMSLIISLPTSAIQKAEEDLLGWVDEYCNDNLLKRLNDAGGISDVAIHTEAIMGSLGAAVAGNQQEVMEDLRAIQERMEGIQRDHKKLLEDLAGAVDKQLQSMETRATGHQKTIEENLGKMVEPVEKTMAKLSEVGDMTGKSASESMQATADAVQSYCKSLTDGLKALNDVLAELGGKQIVIEKPPRTGFLFFGRGKKKGQDEELEKKD